MPRSARRSTKARRARPALVGLTVALAALAAAAHERDEVVIRREPEPTYPLDLAFQRDGGVQYFYELVRSEAPPEKSATFARWRPFDVGKRYDARRSPLHVVMGRISYVLDKDLSFFSEQQVRDPAYISAIAHGYGITQAKDGTYRASKMPSNAFRITYLDAAAVQREAGDGGVARLHDLQPNAALPAVVVMQENYDFSRVLGVRTGEYSYTWTAHYPLQPGQTLIDVATISYLHSAPPFFLGGDARIAAESLDGTRGFIRALRAYRPDAGVR